MVRRYSSGSLLSVLALVAALACRDARPIDAASLEHTLGAPRLRVTILGAPADPRIASVREAIAHWNAELHRTGRRVQLDSGTVRADSISDSALRGASREVMFGRGPATSLLRASLANVPGDVIIALSGTDLISFGIPWQVEHPGVVAIRRSDTLPLSLPNTLRNVVAHEIGPVLGLGHNFDSSTLMCGRPARCRPSAFASDSAYYFPLTAADERSLRSRWP